MSSIKKSSITAVCIALCYILPLAFHATGLGMALSPIHLPVLLCGLICGPLYGAFCGIAGPVLSSVLSGMPPAIGLVSMIPELITYAVVCGLLMKHLPFKNIFARLYVSLVPAMIAGRVMGILAKILFYFSGLSGEATLSIAKIASAYFVATLPGAAAQLVILPLLIFTLQKAKLIKV